MRLAAPTLLLLLAATAPALPNGARLEQRQRAQAEATDEIIVYKAKPGETLQSIAGKWFERPEDWRKAQALNKVKDPSDLAVGTALRLRSSWLKSTMISAELAAFRGDVRVVRGKAAQPVMKGMELSEGDIVETGSNGFATLTLPDKSQVSLPSASRIRLARLRQVPMSDSIDRRFTLEQGKSEAKVTPMANPASRFLISTPVAVAAVRGTQFRVTYTPGEMRAATEVTEGKVAVARRGGIEEVLVRANFGNITTSTGSTAAFHLLPAPAIETPERLQDAKSVTFKIQPVPGAVRYLVEIATDAGFVDRVGSQQFDGDIAVFDAVPNGDYHVRAFAVDGHGLTGLPSEHSFKRDYAGQGAAGDGKGDKAKQIALLGEDGEKEFDWFEDGAGDLLLTVSDGGTGFVGGGGGGFPGGDPLIPEDGLELEPSEPIDEAPATVPDAGQGGGFIGGGGGAGGGGAGGGGGGGGGGSGGGGSGGGESEPAIVDPPVPGGPDGGEGPVVIPVDPAPPTGVPGEGDPGPGGGGNTGGQNPQIPGIPAGAVPEPASWALLIAGFGLIGFALRRRRIALRA